MRSKRYLRGAALSNGAPLPGVSGHRARRRVAWMRQWNGTSRVSDSCHAAEPHEQSQTRSPSREGGYTAVGESPVRTAGASAARTRSGRRVPARRSRSAPGALRAASARAALSPARGCARCGARHDAAVGPAHRGAGVRRGARHVDRARAGAAAPPRSGQAQARTWSIGVAARPALPGRRSRERVGHTRPRSGADRRSAAWR